MQSVNELKQLGFTVQAAAEAEGCTEVRSEAEFHYFNPKFLDDAAELAGSLKAADMDGAGYRIIVAGICSDLDTFPLVLLTAAQVAEVQTAHSHFETARIQRDAAIKKVGETGAVLAGLLDGLVN